MSVNYYLDIVTVGKHWDKNAKCWYYQYSTASGASRVGIFEAKKKLSLLKF